jgi:alkylresorcinol/alkylpyrone synthase
MPHVLSVRSALPENYYSQAELLEGFLAAFAERQQPLDVHRARRFFSAVQVGGRRLALPLRNYATLDGFENRNREWLRVGLELGETALSSALADSGLKALDLDLIVSSTVTGLAVPSLEARLMNRLQFSPNCRRLPLFGLGCVAGAAGVARVTDYLRAYPDRAAALLCVELCSLNFQWSDSSVANLVACGLFGDGAACVVMVGDEHPLAGRSRAAVADTRAVFFPNTEDVMGWDIADNGFRVVLSGRVPELARTALAPALRTFLSEHRLTPRQISSYIAHPGGPAVIDALEQSLELEAGALWRSRDCLARVGNLSSASVLLMLEEAMAAGLPSGPNVLLAMGPGFCAELVLLSC